MKKNTLQKMMLAAALLTLVSCAQDELTEQSTALPDGVYPITFTAVQALPEETPDGTPQTRVSDNGNKSSWTDGDRIMVTVSGVGDPQQTACTLDAKGEITAYDPQLYWQTTGNYTIDAWYSNISEQATTTPTVSLADQRSGLAYVLKAKTINASYQTASEDMKLEFEHQLAKIRVELTGEKADDVTSVIIQGYTSCTVNQGSVSTTGAASGEIKMHPNTGTKVFEANVVPGQAITKFKINGSGDWINLKTNVTPEAGKWHKITIDVKSALINPDEAGTISGDGEYLISGSGTKTLTISGGSPIVTLQGVNIKVTDNNQNYPAIAITGGSPTIKIVGKNNTLESVASGGIMLSNNASVTITGEGKEKSKLTVKAGGKGDGRGNSPSVGIGAASSGAVCGDISISGVTLDVTAGDLGAAIGTSGNRSSCGNIIISNSVIKATGGKGAAAIGLGYIASGGGSNTVKDISITSSEVTAIVTDDGWGAIGAGIGMCQLIIHTYTCGKIILDAKSVEELTAFTTDWKVSGTATDKGYKIGKGYYSTAWGTPTVNFGGLYLNKQDKTQFNADGWGTW